MAIHMFTVEQAAEVLGARPSTIRTYCREGKIPAMKVGRGYRIAEEDLTRWLKRQKKNSDFVEEWDQRAIEEEQKYKDLFENASDAIIIIDKRGLLGLSNPRAKEIFGYSEEELKGKHFARFICPEDLPKVTERFMAMMAGEDVLSRYETRCFHRDGTVITIEINSSPVVNRGDLVGIQMVMRDISERKRMEDELKKFKFISDNSNDAHFLADAEARFIYVNRIACEKLGFSQEELLNLTVPDVDPIYNIHKYQDLFKEARQRRVPVFETVIKRKDGTTFPGEISSTGIELDGRPCLFSDLRDISDRKNAEKVLRESEAKYRSLVENAIEGIAIAQGKRVVFTNKALVDILGYENQEEVLKVPLLDLVVPRSRDFIRKRIKASEKGEKLQARYELSILRKDKEIRDIEISSSEAIIEGEKYTQNSIKDITERKKAEEAIKRSQERYYRLFEDSPISLWEEDWSEVKKQIDKLQSKGIKELRRYLYKHPDEVVKLTKMVKINDVNKKTLEVYGAASKKQLVSGLSEIFSKESYDGMKKALIFIAKGINTFELENINRTLEGDKKYMMLRWAAVPGYEKTLSKVIVSIIDFTERKRMEEMLQESEERIRAQYDSIPIPSYTWQKTGKSFILINHNKAAVEITKGNIPDYLGMKVEDLYADMPEIVADINHCYLEKTPIFREMLYVFKSTGEKRYLDVSYDFIAPDMVIIHTKDVTEQKEAEAKLQELEEIHKTLLKIASEAIVMTDAKGNITGASDRILELLGFDSDAELIGKSMFELIGSEDQGKAKKNLDKIRKNHPASKSQYILAKKDGACFKGYLNISPLRDSNGEIHCFLTTISPDGQGKK